MTQFEFVTTQDVEKLFSKASGKDLKPFFDFYLRTTDILDINVKEIGFHKYQIKINNFFMPMPIEITTNGKTNRMMISKEGITVNSALAPQVDAKGFYLKKVTIK